MDVEFLIAIVKNTKMKQNAELKQRALTIEKKLGMMSHYKSIDNTSINKNLVTIKLLLVNQGLSN
jgi:hypothetical protein